MSEPNVYVFQPESVEERRRKRKRKMQKRRITVTVILLIGVIIGIMFTPLFHLKTVLINGNERVAYDEFIKKGSISTGKNIFTLNLNKIGDGISKIPYIDSVEVKRKLPNKLLINVTECIPVAYIKTKKGCAVIDKNGKILETATEKGDYRIPEITGMVSETYKPLENISVKEEEKFKKTLEILRDLYNNNFIDIIVSISVSDKEITMKKSDAFIIKMGSYEQFNAKIVMVKEILAGLPADAVGTLDATKVDRVYYDRTNPLAPEEETPPPETSNEPAVAPPPKATTEQLYN